MSAWRRPAAPLALTALAAIPLLYWPGLYHVHSLPKAVVFRLAAAALLVCAFGALTLGRRVSLRVRLPDALLAALVAWLGLTSLVNPYPLASLLGAGPRYEGWLGFAGYAVFFLAVSRLRPRDLRHMLVLLAASGAVAGALALFEVRGWYSPLGAGAFGARAVSTLGNPVFLGALEAMTVYLTVGWLLIERTFLGKGLALAAIALQAAGLYLSLSRGAWLGTLAGAAVFALVVAIGTHTRAGTAARRGGGAARAPERQSQRRPQARPWLAAAVFTIVLAAGAAAALSPEGTAAGAQRVAEAASAPDQGTGGTRLLMWQGTLRLIGERPLLGHGLETFLGAFPAVRDASLLDLESAARYPDRPHNDLLYLAFAGGAPALSLYLAFLALLVFRGLKTAARSRDHYRVALLGAFAAAAAAYQVQAAFSFSLPMTTPLGMAALGGAAALSAPSRRRGTERRVAPGGAPPRVLGILALVLAAVFLVEGVRPLLADRSFMRAQTEPWDRVQHLSQAVSLAPRDVDFALALAQAHRQAGDEASLRAAEAVYAETQEGLPYHPDLDAGRANLLRGAGRLDEAEALYDGVLARDPFHPTTLFNLGSLRLERGRAAEAGAPLRRLLSFAPEDGQAWYLLGLAEERSGKRTEAEAAYARAVALAPGEPRYREALVRLQGDR